MRSVDVSTDVFARIWALRQEGENTEDAVLKRVLLGAAARVDSASGITDTRFGVAFPEGFQVFRTYLGQRHKARVERGAWRLDGDEAALSSLNELSRAIGAKTENAWQNWLFNTQEGPRPVSALRDPTRISSRRSPMGSAHSTPANSASEGESQMNDARWIDDVKRALTELGGKAPLQQIYDAVEKIRKEERRSVPRTLDATIRRTLEDHSADSRNYRGRADLFALPEGKGAGVWALRQ
jgi:hypothetical protein